MGSEGLSLLGVTSAAEVSLALTVTQDRDKDRDKGTIKYQQIPDW